MKVLWGVKKGNPDWDEVLLTTREEYIEFAKKLGERDGYDRFRVAEIEDNPPDFAGTVKKL